MNNAYKVVLIILVVCSAALLVFDIAKIPTSACFLAVILAIGFLGVINAIEEK